MSQTFVLTLAQLNPVLGAFAQNAERAKQAWEEGKAAGADFIALPEMFLTGYQAQDLVLKPAFVADAYVQIEALARDVADGPALGIGAPVRHEGQLYNGYFVLAEGQIQRTALKHHLPNTHVFDERRLFAHGPLSGPVDIGGVRIGLPICEDAWFEDVAETAVESGA
ncbi:MAG: nitrilase-related carbon-nitrogen hydrolase, partial [Pseudomonadota bacterium]